MKGEDLELRTEVGRHPMLCRWWLRTRSCRLGIQLNNDGTPPCIEFYVPWWAWPLELLHIAVFGRAKLTAE